MSKIQKALDALKETPRKRPPGMQPDRLASESRSNDRAWAQHLDVGEWTAAEEIHPKRKVLVDLAALADSGLLPDDDYAETIAQQFRRIKRPVLQCAFDLSLPVSKHANVVMVVSALPGAGKSFCALNLANNISTERDFDAVLVDADVLKPGLTQAFGLGDHVGLIDYLEDPELDVTDIMVETDLNGTIVIPAGRSHPDSNELLASRRMAGLVNMLSERLPTRVIVFDTPPLLLTNEAQVLADKAGQIVLVIEAQASSQESVAQALSLLDREKPINAILNKSKGSTASGYNQYGYGYVRKAEKEQSR